MNFVKANLNLYIPSLIELITKQDFPWDRIDKAFLKLLDTRNRESNGKTILIEASIYDVIIAAKKEDVTAIGLLHFLNKLFEELIVNLELSEKILVRENVKHMLMAFDIKYLDFLGEIAVLNNVIKSKTFRLDAIEEKMLNGKSIDFKFRSIKTQSVLLVEVLNIHLDTSRIEINPEAISKFLIYRLSEKVKNKKKGLVLDVPFYLIPVIWGEWQDIKVYSDFFKSNSLNVTNVIEPVSYLTYTDHNGYYEHYFSPITKLFK